MPDHENVLGFSNRWYLSARATATLHMIGEGRTHRIRVVDAPHFIATKLQAFRGRADGDFYHHDMEDLLAVVDGRVELLDELTASPESVRLFIAQEFQRLLEDDAFRGVDDPSAQTDGNVGLRRMLHARRRLRRARGRRDSWRLPRRP